MATKRERLLKNVGITEKGLKGEGIEAAERALISVGIDGIYTKFTFKKAEIDEDFNCFITLELDNDEEIKDFKMKNDINLILGVGEYEDMLFPLFENIVKGGQLELTDTDGSVLGKMVTINNKYWEDYNKFGKYQFTGRLVQMTDKRKTKIKMEIHFDVMQKFNELEDNGHLWKMAIVIQ